MDATPTIGYLANRIPAMSKEEALDAINLVLALPGGKKAIKEFAKKLTPKERKAMCSLINFVISPFDLLNAALEAATNLVYLLP